MAPGPARDSLADVLERVLDKGVVIVGDIVVSIVDIELLTLKLRLLISSADTAMHLGLDWWSNDPFFSRQGDADTRAELDRLRARIAELEARLSDGQTAEELPRQADESQGSVKQRSDRTDEEEAASE
jgi:hypothetical protein